MITKAMKKGKRYAKEQSEWRKNFMGIPYEDFEEYLMACAYKVGYESALKEVADLIKSSKAPNVKKLLEIIES